MLASVTLCTQGNDQPSPPAARRTGHRRIGASAHRALAGSADRVTSL
jgi:hypothetical protein